MCLGTAGRTLLLENNEGTVVCTAKEAAGHRTWQLSPTCSARGSCQPTTPRGSCMPANEPRSEAQGHRRSCRLTGFSCRRFKLTAASPKGSDAKGTWNGLTWDAHSAGEVGEPGNGRVLPGLSPQLELVLALRSGFAVSLCSGFTLCKMGVIHHLLHGARGKAE